ncbi:probable weak neurotoxin NNAM2 [Dendronephthya gigantea]|uniref:probable weak neurotoxin NNAM2 n=1 Tax=Dendronephthya gigantea TaxID=151771 RepID=UPI00106B2307|nr:probable weak neurotoxin NNAM2 [Dendronephthya gigantea]
MASIKGLLIGLPVLVCCFLTASSLTCYKCEGDNTPPMCNETEICSTGNTQCLSQVEKDGDGKMSYKRGCTIPASCSAKKTACLVEEKLGRIDDCSYECCDTDNCNDKFPALGSGVQVTSGIVAIAATLFFALFVM